VDNTEENGGQHRRKVWATRRKWRTVQKKMVGNTEENIQNVQICGKMFCEEHN
jgi:hypothetical protein